MLTLHSRGKIVDKAQGICRDELISSLGLQVSLVTGRFSASVPAPCLSQFPAWGVLGVRAALERDLDVSEHRAAPSLGAGV